MKIAGSTGSKKRLRKMEIGKLVWLLVGIGLSIFVGALYVSSDTLDRDVEKRASVFAGLGLGMSASGLLIYLLM